MKRKLMALLLTGSFIAAGSAHAADQSVVSQGHGYSSSQIGSLPAWDNPPDMDPNVAGIVIPLGRIFATWIIKNHKTVWYSILGTFGYVAELGDGTLNSVDDMDDFENYSLPDKYTPEDIEACSKYEQFNDASDTEKNNGVNGGYDEEYSLGKNQMDYLKWFCSGLP